MEHRFSKETPRPNTVFALFDLDFKHYLKTQTLPITEKGQTITVSSSESSSQFPMELSFHPLKHYFDFAFYVCLSPFKFIKVYDAANANHLYSISTSTKRKTISFITFVLSMLYYITTARKRFEESQQSSVINYFYFVHNFFHCAMLACFYRAVSTKTGELLKLVNGFGITSLIHSNSSKVRLVSLFLHFLYVGTFVFLLLFDWIGLLVEDWTMRKLFHKSMLYAKYAIFIDQYSNSTFNNFDNSLHDWNLGFLDFSLSLFSLLIVISYSLTNTFQTFSFLHCPISLWVAVNNFLKVVNGGDHDKEHQYEKNWCRNMSTVISQKFNELQKLSEFINSAWGMFYFVSLLDSVAWLATDLDASLKTKDWASRGSAAWHFVTITLFFVVSAECTRKMASFKTWLIQYGKRVYSDENELSDLINIADTNTVGIGIDGLYRVDYPFVGQRKITYSITAVHLALLVVLPFLSLLDAFERNDWKILATLKQSLEVGKRHILVNHFPSLNATLKFNSTCPDGSIFVVEIIFGAMNLLISLPYHLLSSYRITSFLYPGMILHSATKKFVNEALNSVPGYCNGISQKDCLLQKYSQLKKLTEALNEVWSVTFFFVMVDHTLWLTTDLNLGIHEKAWTRKVIVTWFFIGVIILMVYASEVSRKMTIFKAWVVENGPGFFTDEREQTNFLNILDINGIWIGKIGLYKFDYNFMGQKRWMWFPFHFVAIVMIATLTMLTNFALPKNKWILTEHFHNMADPIKSLFQSVDEQEDSNILIENVSTFDLSFGFLFGFMEFLSCLEVSIRVLCCLHPMSLLLTAVNSFLKRTYYQKGNKGAQWLTLTRNYGHLKQLSSIISDTWGPLIFCFVLDYTVWLATDLDAALRVKKWATGITTVYFMVTLLISTILCAEVSRRMASFKVWMIRNGDSIFGNRQDEFTRFLHSLDDDQVGVGISGVYQMDYPFLGQIVVLIVTFFLITLQYDRRNIE
ncbi:unnamed protein product [Orchesella dallaii]|uniref:Uncharacterized protein n=1 Tax=Orchesella dallaii TaxID=48710 RepID=A0ABP1QHQ6_9HEXA